MKTNKFHFTFYDHPSCGLSIQYSRDCLVSLHTFLWSLRFMLLSDAFTAAEFTYSDKNLFIRKRTIPERIDGVTYHYTVTVREFGDKGTTNI